MTARPARRLVAGVLLLGLAGLGLVACSSTPKPDGTARSFLSDWAAGSFTAAAKQTDSPATAAKELSAAGSTLGKPKLAMGAVSTKDKAATVSFTASWSVPGVTSPWTYTGRLPLTLAKDSWTVHWTSADIHPKLADGATIQVSRELPARAALLDRSGTPLFTNVPTVTVGIQPSKVTSLPTLAAALAKALGVSATTITTDVKKAKPNDFVPVITLRRSAYETVKPKIYSLPGTVFQTGTESLGPTADFGQPLLGKVGQATADALKQAGSNYRAGDSIGISGLQESLNSQLAGTATATFTGVLSAGGTTDKTVLGTVAGTAGTPVKLTLDKHIQTVADAALAQITAPAAIVAVQASTGQVLAAANSPSAPFDIAMSGKYPPGSTWKIITATAALQNNVVQAGSTVACPGTVNLGGRVVPNENKFDLGNVSMTTAFAQSCNTVFAPLSVKLPVGALAKTAAQFGIGAAWQLPEISYSGAIPAASTSIAERAAKGYGQGQDLVSPFAEALIAATIAHGSVPTPSLVLGKPASATNPPPGTPISASVLAALRSYMRAVVTSGTATNLRSVPGDPVRGKTGTAEYGPSPPKAHSWFTGYQGDVAFSVFVYGGQSSGQLANPVAKAFLDGIQ